MRTDVKVGLICVFGIILAVVIYFVAQSQNHPRSVQASDTVGPATTSPAASPAASPGSLQVAPAPAGDLHTSPDTHTLSIASAQVPSGGPGNNMNGTMIPLPSPSSPVVAPGSAPPATSPAAPGSSFHDLTGGTPMNSTPLIPSPTTTGPASGFTGSSGLSSGGMPLPDHTIDTPTPGFNNSHSGTSGMSGTHSGFDGSAESSRLSGLTGGTLNSSSGSTYTVVKGDTLGSISKAKGVSLKALEAANKGVDSTKLKIGQPIKIPAPGDSAAPTSVSAASTRPSRSAAHSAAAATTRPSGAAKPGSTYTVKKGDTLGKIAQSVYGNKSAWQRIFRANRGEISDPDVVPIGTVLKLPS